MLLLRDQKLTVSEICGMLNLPQANVSQHLTTLRSAKVVKTEKLGKNVYYSLAHPNYTKTCDLVQEVLIDQNKGQKLEEQLEFSMKQIVPLTSDPVCKMRISPKTATSFTSYNGKNYYFCASGCLKKFQKDPTQYADENNL